jgi:hypothetical protein
MDMLAGQDQHLNLGRVGRRAWLCEKRRNGDKKHHGCESNISHENLLRFRCGALYLWKINSVNDPVAIFN